MCQNSYKKALGGPQSAQKAPRPSQNLPKTLPKPSPNPSQIRRAACSARRVRAHRHLLLFNFCISLLGGAMVRFRQGARRPKFRQVGSMLAHFSLLSASWVHFSRLAAFVAPFGRFFRDLGRSSLDFGAPSWPYVGTHFALDGIFRHAAGIAAKKPCWHSLSVFRFHNAARRYVRSTWNR